MDKTTRGEMVRSAQKALLRKLAPWEIAYIFREGDELRRYAPPAHRVDAILLRLVLEAGEPITMTKQNVANYISEYTDSAFLFSYVKEVYALLKTQDVPRREIQFI